MKSEHKRNGGGRSGRVDRDLDPDRDDDRDDDPPYEQVGVQSAAISVGVLELTQDLRRLQNDYGLTEIRVALRMPHNSELIWLSLTDEPLMTIATKDDREVRAWPRSLDG